MSVGASNILISIPLVFMDCFEFSAQFLLPKVTILGVRNSLPFSALSPTVLFLVFGNSQSNQFGTYGQWNITQPLK